MQIFDNTNWYEKKSNLKITLKINEMVFFKKNKNFFFLENNFQTCVNDHLQTTTPCKQKSAWILPNLS